MDAEERFKSFQWWAENLAATEKNGTPSKMPIIAVRPLLAKGFLSARPIKDPEIAYPLSLVRSAL